MDIAYVTETFPPEVNGVALTALRFVQGLRARGHEVNVVRPAQDDEVVSAADSSGSSPGADYLCPGLTIPMYRGLRAGLPSGGRLRKHWTQRPPDLVHVATEGPLGWSAMHTARRLGIAVTSDFRTDFEAYSRHYRLGLLSRPIKAYLRHFHNTCDRTFVATNALCDQLRGEGYREVQVVARGVDLERFDPARRSAALRAQWGAGESTPVALYVGRLAAEKNLDLLFATYRALRALRGDLRLIVVGDGPQRAGWQNRYPDVVFCGALAGENLAVHYASADFFIFPSLTETFGNVTIEALASGLPVVAFDYAAAGEHVRPGHCGHLVACTDEPGFIDSACRLLHSPHELSPFRRAAREAALGLSWERVITDFEAGLVCAVRNRRSLVPEPSVAILRYDRPDEF